MPPRRVISKTKASPDDLAKDLASKLKIQEPKGKQKHAAQESYTKVSAMKTINEVSQSFSELVKSGWKKSSEEKLSRTSSSQTKATTLCIKAAGALAFLRGVEGINLLDVERAAGSIISKLIALELYDLAVQALTETRTHLLSLYLHDPESESELLSLPLPSSTIDCKATSTLLSSYLAYATAACCATREMKDLSPIVFRLPTLLQWNPTFSQTLTVEQRNSVLTRVYSAMLKANSSRAPDSENPDLDIYRYCLLCLIHVTTIADDAFWGQVMKITGSYLRSQDNERTASIQIHRLYLELVQAVETARPSATSAANFGAFCQTWLAFGQKTRDVAVLDEIRRMMTSPSKGDEEDKVLNLTLVVASLKQASTALEQGAHDGLKHRLEAAKLAVRQAGQLLGKATSDPDTVSRNLLKLRSACTSALERPQCKEAPQVRSLLDEILSVFRSNLSGLQPLADGCSQLLDSFFVLSSVALVPSTPSTHAESYSYLARAAEIVSSELIAEKLSAVEKSNFLRCISSAAHNHAVKLYQDGKHAAAIKFLDDACTLGQQALLIRGSDRIEDEDEKELKRWQSLEETMYRRWELLGVCFSRVGGRRQMFDSFMKSLLAFPYSQIVFEAQASNSSLFTIFASSPALQQLGVLVDRVTVLGATELNLDNATISFFQFSEALPRSTLGALIERQVKALDEKLWKKAAPLVSYLLENLLELYSPADMPIRRSRVLLSGLEISFQLGFDQLSWARDYAEVAKDIIQLCTQSNLGLDSELACFAEQIMVTAKLWVILHSYRENGSNGEGLATITQTSIEDACGILQAISKGYLKKDNVEEEKPQKSRAVRKTRSQRSTVGKAKSVQQSKEVPLPIQKAIPAKLDPGLKFLSLLESVSYLSGLLGLALPNVHLLHSALRVFQVQGLREEHVTLSTLLANELHRLGKRERARTVYLQALDVARENSISDELMIQLNLQYANLLADEGELDGSVEAYQEAVSLSQRLPPEDKNNPSSQRIMQRAEILVRAAMAAHTFGSMQSSRSDLHHHIEGLLQGTRLWNRAMDAISRLHQPAADARPPAQEDNPFMAPAAQPSTAPGTQPVAQPSKVYQRKKYLMTIEWRITSGLASTLTALSKAYIRRGSPRESEFFAQQALDLTNSLCLPAVIASAWCHKAQVQLYQGLDSLCEESIEQATKHLGEVEGITTAELNHLRGELDRRAAREAADQRYESAAQVLWMLEASFGMLDKSRKSLSALKVPQGDEHLGSTLLANILFQIVWSLRHNASEEFSQVLEQFMSLRQTPQNKVLQNFLMAKLTLHDVYQLFQSDMFLSSVPESTMALPTKTLIGSAVAKSSSIEILKVLDTAEALFWNDLSETMPHGDIAHIREVMRTLSLVKTLQASIGKPSSSYSTQVSRLLDASAVVVYRRDLFDAISAKLTQMPSPNDLGWPKITADGSPVPKDEVPESVVRRGLINFQDEEPFKEETNPTALDRYWEVMRQKYSNSDIASLKEGSPQAAHLPRSWTVVHIDVSPDRETLLLSRQCGADCDCQFQSTEDCPCREEPLVFCIPLSDRRANSDESEESQLNVSDALSEISEIIHLSDEGSRSGGNIRDGGDADARRQWWRKRAALDERLKTLLENIEFCWFGAFKIIFNVVPDLDMKTMTNIRVIFGKAFERGLRLPTQDKRRSMSPSKNQPSQGLPLDDALVACFATLSPKCRDEELEDLIYFILDLYQYQGLAIAIAEVDIDQMVVDVRAALEEVATVMSQFRQAETANPPLDHLFLVLGKDLQVLPWESMPALRGRSISRIPNIEFLHDQMTLNSSIGCATRAGARIIDSKKTSYFLNPSGDLNKTEDRFRPWLKEMKSLGWDGVIGKAPTEHQFLTALEENELVLYFGHGGGEQYIRSHKLRNLKQCACTMLWGCSSGALRDMGDFDRVGNPYNYLLAGCPTLVANLWDVTDGDIDRFSQSVFDNMKLSPKIKQASASMSTEGPKSVVSAVAMSRSACKLKYLTGAAPVVYGMPFLI